VRRASRSIGLYVAAAEVIVLLIGVAVLIITVLQRSVEGPEGPNQQNPGGPQQPGGPGGIHLPPFQEGVRLWIDAERVVWVILILAVCGVVAMGLIAWLVARRAVAPLAEALQLQRHFVADASHELRTPLTVLNTRIQLLQRRLARGDDITPTLAQLRSDTEVMADVLDDLLLTVEGSTTSESTLTYVAPCVREATTSLQVIADQAHISLNVTADEHANVAVAVPARSLSRSVIALVDNAIQHSRPDSSVEVIMETAGSDVNIRVRDHGAGIDAVDPDKLFERFAHGAETGRKRSFGLGLALVSEVAQRFGGDITVEDTGDQGTTFLLRFPRA
jgi:signal transduction histidine kinase